MVGRSEAVYPSDSSAEVFFGGRKGVDKFFLDEVFFGQSTPLMVRGRLLGERPSDGRLHPGIDV